MAVAKGQMMSARVESQTKAVLQAAAQMKVWSLANMEGKNGDGILPRTRFPVVRRVGQRTAHFGARKWRVTKQCQSPGSPHGARTIRLDESRVTLTELNHV